MPLPRTIAQLSCGFSVGVLAALCWLLARWPDAGVLAPLLQVAVLLPALVLGLVIAQRRPANRIAPLLCLLGAVPLAVFVLGDAHAAAVAGHPGEVPVWPLVVALAQGSWILLYLPGAALLLTFPDGRLPGRRWRPVGAGLLLVPALFLVLAALGPAPFPAPFQEVAHPLETLPETVVTVAGGVLLAAFLGLLTACAAAPVLRYRRATDPLRRAQLRWLALGALALPGALLVCWLSYLLWGVPDLVAVGLGVVLLAVPVATAIAVLRHDLYDLDRALSATLTYAAVATVLLAVFTAVEVAGGVLIGGNSVPLTAVATALAAATLTVVRAPVHRWMDRRLYPRRHAVRVALAELDRRIERDDARPEDLEVVLRAALHDPGLRVVFLLPGRDGLVDGRGAALSALAGRTVPVRLGGHQVGALAPTDPRTSGRLLADAATAGAVLVGLIRSRLELRLALDEVAASRARLLAAGYEERRRLERDLHDGAQQRLVSLGMALRLAQRHLPEGGLDVDGLIDQAVAELGTAVAELRAIAHGLRPASLNGGLAPALRALSSSVPIPVRLRVCEEPVPDDVATTAYYIASEALTNAVKHAAAATIDLLVSRRDGCLRIVVADDGRGGIRLRPGSGLAGLADRAAAAGGRITVRARHPRGAVVEAELPCGR